MPAADPLTEALLRWSFAVHAGTVTLLALFFVTLSRSVALAEVGLWARAWGANLLGVATSFAVTTLGLPEPGMRALLALEVGASSAWALLLVGGARHHLRPGVELPLRPGIMAGLVVSWGLFVAVAAPHSTAVVALRWLGVGAILAIGATWVLRNPRAGGAVWLGSALLALAVVSLARVLLLLALPPLEAASPAALAAVSFAASAADLLVALGILVALQGSATEHLRHLNQELIASQDRLRQLADLDPLTNLANRRSLRTALDDARATGAALVFLDLRGFKQINDRFGHIVGDACLRRVATALGRVFRAGDGLFRWGGDEFLVIAPGLDESAARARLADAHALLAAPGTDTPALFLSAGIAILPRDGEPDAALRAADAAMVADKSAAKQSLQPSA